MARIFYVHWNKEEALRTARSLRDAAHTVICHFSTEEGAGNEAWRKIRKRPPDGLVVSLERLPSHGRRIAAVTQQYKALRDVPVIFVDGEDEKVQVAKEQFRDAVFVRGPRLAAALAKL